MLVVLIQVLRVFECPEENPTIHANFRYDLFIFASIYSSIQVVARAIKIYQAGQGK
jgi:hypothetical protein